MFLHEKDGYNKKQVNTKIESMHKELTNLKRSLEEKDKLNLGLATALEKSKEIEASTFNLYELKIKKILIFIFWVFFWSNIDKKSVCFWIIETVIY